jgi:hypothetical protein
VRIGFSFGKSMIITLRVRKFSNEDERFSPEGKGAPTSRVALRGRSEERESYGA